MLTIFDLAHINKKKFLNYFRALIIKYYFQVVEEEIVKEEAKPVKSEPIVEVPKAEESPVVIEEKEPAAEVNIDT